MMSPDQIRKEFCEPLTMLAGDFAKQVQELESLTNEGKTQFPHVEQNVKLAQDALLELKRFYRVELEGKIAQIKDGVYRWRAAETKLRQQVPGNSSGS